MRYDPEKHHRRSIRLRSYNYAAAGTYFVTICSQDRGCVFGEIIDGAMHINQWGLVVDACWNGLPSHYGNVRLDAFVVMPNHIHGIILIAPRTDVDVGARHASPLHLGTVIGSFKSAAARQINILRDAPGCPVWQRNYYEHIIRGEKVLHAIRRYVEDNPTQWAFDPENPVNISANRI